VRGKDNGTMKRLDYLVGQPEEYIIKEATEMLGEYGIDYMKGYVYCGDSNEAYCEIADIYYDMKADMEDDLKKALDAGDMHSYAINVHGLKNNAKSLGIDGLADVAYDHELKSKADDIEYCTSHWPELLAVWNNSIKALSIYLRAMGVDKGFDDIESEDIEYKDDEYEESDIDMLFDDDDDELLNDVDFNEAKDNIRTLIESGMSDIAEEIINELIDETDNPVKIAQLRSMLN